jgi:hypothetical protein
LNSTDGVLHRLGYLPANSDSTFRNINETYDALLELAETKYGQKGERIDGFIHALLKQIVTSSPYNTQEVKIFKKPSEERVQFHKGKLITLLAKKSMITKVGLLIRENCSNLRECLELSAVKNLKTIIKRINHSSLAEKINEIVSPLKENNLIKNSLSSISQEKINEYKFLSSVPFLFKIIPHEDLIEDYVNGMLKISHSKHPFKVKGQLSFRSMVNYLNNLNNIYEKLSKKEIDRVSKHLLESKEKLKGLISPQTIKTFIDMSSFQYLNSVDKKTREAVSHFLKTEKLPLEYIYRSLQSIYQEDRSLSYLTTIVSFVTFKGIFLESNLSKARKELLINKKAVELFLLDHFTMFTPMKN